MRKIKGDVWIKRRSKCPYHCSRNYRPGVEIQKGTRCRDARTLIGNGAFSNPSTNIRKQPAANNLHTAVQKSKHCAQPQVWPAMVHRLHHEPEPCVRGNASPSSKRREATGPGMWVRAKHTPSVYRGRGIWRLVWVRYDQWSIEAGHDLCRSKPHQDDILYRKPVRPVSELRASGRQTRYRLRKHTLSPLRLKWAGYYSEASGQLPAEESRIDAFRATDWALGAWVVPVRESIWE